MIVRLLLTQRHIQVACGIVTKFEMSNTSFIVPRGAERTRAYVCIPVQECVATRSLVIATLMDVEGFAELPDGVDVSDLLAWSDMRPDEASSMSADDLSCALQVGESSHWYLHVKHL